MNNLIQDIKLMESVARNRQKKKCKKISKIIAILALINALLLLGAYCLDDTPQLLLANFLFIGIFVLCSVSAFYLALNFKPLCYFFNQTEERQYVMLVSRTIKMNAENN